MFLKPARAVLGFVVAAAIALAARAEAGEEKRLNVYNWPDYIGEHTAEKFEELTGIKVDYDVYDSDETFETKLLAGHTGYDVVVASDGFLGKQARAGIFAVLDKSKLPNLKYMDPNIMRAAAELDPDNTHSVPYLWGTIGIGFNAKKIAERMADAPVDAWVKPYERGGDARAAMDEYLAWETDLLPRIARDGTTRFSVAIEHGASV